MQQKLSSFSHIADSLIIFDVLMPAAFSMIDLVMRQVLQFPDVQ